LQPMKLLTNLGKINEGDADLNVFNASENIFCRLILFYQSSEKEKCNFWSCHKF